MINLIISQQIFIHVRQERERERERERCKFGGGSGLGFYGESQFCISVALSFYSEVPGFDALLGITATFPIYIYLKYDIIEEISYSSL